MVRFSTSPSQHFYFFHNFDRFLYHIIKNVIVPRLPNCPKSRVPNQSKTLLHFIVFSCLTQTLKKVNNRVYNLQVTIESTISPFKYKKYVTLAIPWKKLKRICKSHVKNHTCIYHYVKNQFISNILQI
jgi:hypothetical protein